MDAEMIERLRSELRALGVSPGEIEHQIAVAVADFARPTSDSDRVTVAMQRKDVYAA